MLGSAEAPDALARRVTGYLRERFGALFVVLRHPAMQWAAGIYRRHRGQSAEIARRAP